MRIIEYYKLSDGTVPAYDFINKLPTKVKARALCDLQILQQKGTLLREPYPKPIDNGLYELRLRYRGDTSRVVFFFYADNKIILTTAFIKKSHVTPKLEIQKANKYKLEYELKTLNMSLNEHLEKEMSNPEFAKEFNSFIPDCPIINKIIDLRLQQNMTQKELSSKMGIERNIICQIECGERTPTLEVLKKIAEGLGKELNIEFR